MAYLSRKRIAVIASIVLAVIIAVVAIRIFTKRNEQKGDGAMNSEIAVSMEQWGKFVSTDLFEKALGDYDWDTGVNGSL